MSIVKVAGFFGQSGVGKSTIIRWVKSPNDEYITIPYTGIIRYLFNKNNDQYMNAKDLLTSPSYQVKPGDNVSVQRVYEKFIRGQFQLLNDYSSEVYINITEHNATGKKSILLYDRSPLDFYVVTACGIEHLKSKLGNIELNKSNLQLLALCKKTAENNTRNFFDAIYVTKPYTQSIDALKDGVRDLYLNTEYTNENWYGKLDELDVDAKIFTIEENIKLLDDRIELVNGTIGELL